MINCLLCLCDSTINHSKVHGIQYLKCTVCHSIFKDPIHHLSFDDEYSRYLTHNNDVEDPRYQQFVQPLVQKVTQKISKDSIGLDFGAGTGPVITYLLEELGYQVKLYDPFFHPDRSLLSNKYDFIICCEVIEHFFNPNKDFRLLKELLKPGGMIFLMTEMLPHDESLQDWYYIKDPTHVFFYSPKSFDWIKDHYSFSKILVEGRTIEIFN